jgi:hypothetical protein
VRGPDVDQAADRHLICADRTPGGCGTGRMSCWYEAPVRGRVSLSRLPSTMGGPERGHEVSGTSARLVPSHDCNDETADLKIIMRSAGTDPDYPPSQPSPAGSLPQRLTTNLTTTNPTNLPSGPTAKAGLCQISHRMPQPARILQPGGPSPFSMQASAPRASGRELLI